MHIFLIDRIERLVIKKDSSLYLALTMQSKGVETYILYQEELSYENQSELRFSLRKFEGKLNEGTGYISEFEVGEPELREIKGNATIQMRMEPPFDLGYLRTLWILRRFELSGLKIINSASGIAINNEKVLAYGFDKSFPTYVGGDFETFSKFILSQGSSHFIVKPLDLFQGIGVEKWSRTECSDKDLFDRKCRECQGLLVAQPFLAAVTKGEIRSTYFKGKEIGSIIKIPKEGEWLANVARGASFEACQLNAVQKKKCDELAKTLMKEGIDWIAYDIIEDKINEVNITCPGLLVETSIAHRKNLALLMVD